jgi:hypothetical protein
MGEHLAGSQGVRGSNPLRSTICTSCRRSILVQVPILDSERLPEWTLCDARLSSSQWLRGVFGDLATDFPDRADVTAKSDPRARQSEPRILRPRAHDQQSEKFRAGGMARVDLDRLVLQRVQYESDLEGARVALHTAKIQLLMMDRAKTDHKLASANGSTNPTFAVWYTYNPSFNNPFD